MWTTKEVEAKIDRIKELKQAGFNTPRMVFLSHKHKVKDINFIFKWAEKIHKEDPKQIFNIRTYKRERDEETLQTKHYTDILYSKLNSVLQEACLYHNCMIDAETPDNGRWAGNILIQTNEFERPDRFIIDYCHKEKRAMVRDHDKNKAEYLAILGAIEEPLETVINKALSFHKKNVILEWTYFCKPAGEKKENLVWWEYRSI